MPPDIDDVSLQILTVNQPYSFTFNVTRSPNIVTIEGLLEGFVYSYDTSTSEINISGTPTVLHPTAENWTVEATNNNGTSTQIIRYRVIELPPVISSIAHQRFNESAIINIDLGIANVPSAVSARGPLLGLTHEKTMEGINISGTIEGNPTDFTINRGEITVSASNTGGSDEYDIIFGFNASPSFLTIPTQMPFTNQPFELNVFDYLQGFPLPNVTASNLPTGLSISNGIISGTPTVEGNRTVTLSASNSRGSDTTMFVIMVAPEYTAPNLTNIPNQSLNVGSSFSYTVTASGVPEPTFTATNLPAGLSINETTGVISGTPITQQTYATVIIATNTHPDTNVSQSDTQNVTFTVDQRLTVPVIANISNRTFIAQTSINAFTATATGFPSPTFSATGLPQGLSINSSSGRISGTPTRNDEGINNVTVRATNSNGSDTETFTITINTLPIFPSISTQELVVGVLYSRNFTIDGTTPITITDNNLPAGITDSINGNILTLSGTTTASTGTSTATLTAMNAAGVDMTTVMFNIESIPTLVNIPVQTLTAGTSYSYTVSATAVPDAVYSATGLPEGISINSSTGAITGTPTRTNQGANNVTVTATNDNGSDSQSVVFTVNAIPIIPNIPQQGLAINLQYNSSFTIDATPNATVDVTGLPNGLTHSLNGQVLTISGTPTQIAMSTVTITATNSVGIDIHNIVFDVGAAFTVPVLANIPAQTVTAGTPYSYTTSATANPTATFSATNLPDGLSIDSMTGEISGTPTRNDAGNNTATIVATNMEGSDSQNVTFTVNTIPALSALADMSFTAGTAITAFNASANAFPTATYTASNLPDGLSINQSTGRISGTPTRTDNGINTVQITATNSVGNDIESFDITINTIPVLNSVSDMTLIAGNAITPFTVSVTNDTYPVVSFTETTLIDGLTLNSSTGQVTGTPVRDDEGTNNVTFIATNAVGNDTDLAVFTVQTKPLIQSIDDEDIRIDNLFSEDYTIEGTTPISVSISGLPTGISHSITGNTLTISGTPTAASTASVTITATNTLVDGNTYSDTENFDIVVSETALLYMMREQPAFGDSDVPGFAVDSETADGTTAVIEAGTNFTTNSDSIRGLAIDADYIYILDEENTGIRVHNLSDRSFDRAFSLGSINALAAGGIAVDDNNIYISDLFGMRVYNKNTANGQTANPTLTFRLPTTHTGGSGALAVRNNILYITQAFIPPIGIYLYSTTQTNGANLGPSDIIRSFNIPNSGTNAVTSTRSIEVADGLLYVYALNGDDVVVFNENTSNGTTADAVRQFSSPDNQSTYIAIEP